MDIYAPGNPTNAALHALEEPWQEAGGRCQSRRGDVGRRIGLQGLSTLLSCRPPIDLTEMTEAKVCRGERLCSYVCRRPCDWRPGAAPQSARGNIGTSLQRRGTLSTASAQSRGLYQEGASTCRSGPPGRQISGPDCTRSKQGPATKAAACRAEAGCTAVCLLG